MTSIEYFTMFSVKQFHMLRRQLPLYYIYVTTRICVDNKIFFYFHTEAL